MPDTDLPVLFAAATLAGAFDASLALLGCTAIHCMIALRNVYGMCINGSLKGPLLPCPESAGGRL